MMTMLRGPAGFVAQFLAVLHAYINAMMGVQFYLYLKSKTLPALSKCKYD